MRRIFLAGLIFGIVTAIGVGGWVPVINRDRIASITRVAPNGGRVESFHIRLPDDRLLRVGGAGMSDESTPSGLYLPDAAALAEAQVELFRIRDREGKVIGLASRLGHARDDYASDWTVYIPTRGALYMTADRSIATSAPNTVRAGKVLDGSESMRGVIGTFQELHHRDATVDGETPSLSIELSTVIQSDRA